MRPALALGLLLAAPAALAHGAAPGSLEYVEHADGRVEERWRPPRGAGVPSGVRPTLPSGCALVSVEAPELAPFTVIERRRLDCGPTGLAGRAVSVTGLDASGDVDVLLRARFASGREHVAVLRGDAPSAVLPRGAASRSVFVPYVAMGARHILGGVDHLLFVLGLLLLVRGTAALAKTVTAFTAGHSVTLALAALGLARASSGAVEACIALSVFALALEAARPPTEPSTLARRAPWVMAGGFGLLHGFGFAGALREAGLPAGRAATALLGFNLGVEAGQLAVVTAALGLARVARRWPRAERWARVGLREALGVASGFWLVEGRGAVASGGDVRVFRRARARPVAAHTHSFGGAQEEPSMSMKRTAKAAWFNPRRRTEGRWVQPGPAATWPGRGRVAVGARPRSRSRPTRPRRASPTTP
ncbi:MAG: HupE/UreJ family protein [Polyangiales bacterium]